jgi:DNA replication protein DnaC
MSNFDPYDDDALLAEAREDVHRERIARRLQLILDRRPPVFAKDGALHPDIQAWTDRYLGGATGSLLLFGAVGTGKTWSLWKTAEVLVQRGWTGAFELVAPYELKEATDRPVDQDKIRIWRQADLFAIDDIGAQHLNGWDTDALHALIDHRWQHGRPTLVALNEFDLRGLLGERIASRLVDGATIVTFSGEDRRRAQS